MLTSPSLDLVRSSLPLLTRGKQGPEAEHQAKGANPNGPQGPDQAKGANPDAPQAPDQAKEADVTAPPSKAAGPRLPARVGKRSVPHVNHGQVLVSQDNQHAPDAAAPEAAGPKQQLPGEEQHASELQPHSAVSVSQAGGTGQPSKKNKDRKEKKRKHKGSKQSLAAQESCAHQDSSSLMGASDRGRSVSLEPSSAAAADDQTAMVRCWLLLLLAGALAPLCQTRPPPSPASPPYPPALPSVAALLTRLHGSSLRVCDAWAAEISWGFCAGASTLSSFVCTNTILCMAHLLQESAVCHVRMIW